MPLKLKASTKLKVPEHARAMEYSNKLRKRRAPSSPVRQRRRPQAVHHTLARATVAVEVSQAHKRPFNPTSRPTCMIDRECVATRSNTCRLHD
jgi:hypothetical protein